jgi:hypothetical protein
VDRSWRCVVGELADRNGDPAPSSGAVVVAGGGELVGAGATFFERFVAVALEHQVGGAPDIDLGYHAQHTAALRSLKLYQISKTIGEFNE